MCLEAMSENCGLSLRLQSETETDVKKDCQKGLIMSGTRQPLNEPKELFVFFFHVFISGLLG